MLSFSDFVTEGVHDPAKLKAIFLAGGPGSGKSYVSRNTTKGLGFKHVDSDQEFERKMKHHGLDPKMPDHEKHERDIVRAHAKHITNKREQLYHKGRLGLVIDGTGKDPEKIKRHSEHLRKLGYDTHMIFVNTSLDVAKKRNADRERSIPEKHVEHMWHQVQGNIGHFQQHFGHDNMHIVDNNHADEHILHKVHKAVRKIATSPIANREGQKWVSDQSKK